MKKLLLSICFLALCLLKSYSQNYAQIASVPISITTTDNPATITLRWPYDANVNSYSIYRKLKDGKSWGTALASYASKDSTKFIDRNVELGKAYEYRVSRNSNSGPGTGYVFAGIKYEATELNYKGSILALIDGRIAASLNSEIQQWKDDLSSEAWNVLTEVIPDTASVPVIKAKIKSWKSMHSDLRTVFIIGHVKVPYSGELNPDGHPDHLGAWPADAYYADLDGIWSDATVNNTSASRVENQNIPRDGKFDQSNIPSDLDLEIGRVDFFNMPVLVKSETELLKNYFKKNHQFRLGQIRANRKGIIMDNFNYNEGFGQSGYKNFSVFFNENFVFNGDYRNDLQKDSYLWSYGAGGGWYQGAGGISESANMAKDSLQTVFTFLFGSYFGDWDSQDNFLRAALASGTILTSAWAGRPHWQVHQMAMGENIGFGVRLTQNNQSLYSAGYSARGVHIALMGDPSLTLFPTKKVTGLSAKENGQYVDLKWDISAEATEGYNVYRRKEGEKNFQLIGSRINAISFKDKCLTKDVRYEYLVRGVNLEKNASGSFYNLSSGTIINLKINNDNSTKSDFVILDDFEFINAKSFSTNSDSILWMINGKPSGSDQKLVSSLECNGKEANICLISKNTCDEDTFCKLLKYDCSRPVLEKVDINGFKCHGDSANVCVKIKGGASPYTYTWENGSGSECFKTLKSGNFHLTVTSRLNTSIQEVINYVEPQALDIALQIMNVPGKGAKVSFMVTGGVPPYTSITSYPDPDNVPPGNYNIYVIDSFGCSKTIYFDVKSSTATQNPDNTFGLQLYPNPADDLISFENKHHLSIQAIHVYNLNGQKVQHFEYPVPGSLPVKGLQSGIYYVEFITGQKTIVIPFVKL